MIHDPAGTLDRNGFITGHNLVNVVQLLPGVRLFGPLRQGPSGLAEQLVLFDVNGADPVDRGDFQV
jgi:hypothetical protein